MRPRYRLALVAGLLALAGCGDFNAGPINYAESERLTSDRPDVPGLKDKPKLQDEVRTALANLFGPSPKEIHVPKGTGLLDGGRWLGSHVKEGDGDPRPILIKQVDPETWQPVFDRGSGNRMALRGRGGYGLYREHCLHCHGVTGDGAGPTAAFLYPRPRDYRRGIFKFTSTNTGSKPTRDDLIKTIRRGIPGTSMPAFDSLMSPEEIRQVVEYVVFLSMRGEVEQGLIDEASNLNEGDKLDESTINDVADSVFGKWTRAGDEVLNPPVPRTESTPESIARGRVLFLGKTKEKLECAGCHGALAEGNGPSIVDMRIFDKVVFSEEAPEIWDWRHSDQATNLVERAIRERYGELQDLQAVAAEHSSSSEHSAGHAASTLEPLEGYKTRTLTTWRDGSFDDWGQPLRAANLNLGVYKGGRRPIDLYWRIAKGINGAKMPAHASILTPEQIWDVVNFVLALPYDPTLLRGYTPSETVPAMARR